MEYQDIYKLEDPRNRAIRYIGMSKDAYQRLAQHMILPTNNAKKDAWILDLRQEGLLPLLSIIESVPLQQARERENYWIHYYLAEGQPLTNILKKQAANSIAPIPSNLVSNGLEYKVMRVPDGYRIVCVIDNQSFREIDGGSIYPSRQNAYHRCKQLNEWLQGHKVIPEQI